MLKKYFRALFASLFFLFSATIYFSLYAAPPSAALPVHTPPQRSLACPAPRLDLSGPAIALTFDDGPHPKYTDMILDTLEENSAKGTFFIIGERINYGLPQIKRILHSHQLGNHTWGHVDLSCQNAEGVTMQIASVYDSVNGLFSKGPLLVRPPYGFFNDIVKENVGYPMIHWSIDTMDWYTLDSEKTVQHVLENVQDGDIILMHDIYPTTAEAVRQLVPQLAERGFQMVTVSELFALKGIPLEPGKLYMCAR